ncbi:MAG: HEAT repeat domain-containing protein, partial [Planctomycetota bacterium]|nr:HEAT repeat domain-containing protein [Planctomycetota bacterium]
ETGKEPREAAEGDRLIDEMAALALCGRADRTRAGLAVRLMDHGHAQVRIAAAIALGGAFRADGNCARTAPEIQELKRRAHNDPSALVRVACCVSLYAAGEKDDARRSLIKWLEDPRSHPTVAAYAALALGEMPHEDTYRALAGALAHKSELVRLNAVLALGHMPRKENVDLLIRHGAAETDMATRGEIALAMMNHDPEPRIGAFLRGYLRDARAMVRSRAAIALERYDDPDTTKELLALLRDREDDVRAQAALSLAARKTPAGRAELEKLLRTEESEFVRWCAKAALERMSNGKALPGLFDMLVERRRTLHCSPADEMERLYTQAYSAVLRLDSRDMAEKLRGRSSSAGDLDRRDGAKLADSPQAPPEPPTSEAIRKRIGDPPKEPMPPDPPPSVERFLDRESYDRAVRDLGSCWASHPGPEKIEDAPSAEREWLKNYIQQYRDAYRRYLDDVRRYSVERKAYEKAVAEYREKMMEYERKEAETRAEMEAAWEEWERRVQAGMRYQDELGRFSRQGEKFLGDLDRILDRYSRPSLGGGLLSNDDLKRMQESNRFLFGQYGLPSLNPGDERGSAKLIFLPSSPVSPEGDLVQWFRRFLYHRDGSETSYDSATDPRFRW